MAYDTVIIGAGLSGLAAGIRLAYFEKSVCVLERHTTIGGLNSFYRLRDRNHDVGLHAVTNYVPPGANKGPLVKLLRQLRLSWGDFDLSPQIESSIIFPGYRLRFNNSFDYLRQQVAAAFPQQIDQFDRLTEFINAQPTSGAPTAPVSARSVVGAFLSDRTLVDMLFCPILFYGSATPDDMDFSLFAILFRSIFVEGLSRPYEGIRRILRTLVKKFKSLGGELRLRAGVQSIKTDRGRATGVVLDNGDVIEARNVLSSAGSVETLQLIRDRREVPTPQPGDISFVEAIYSLDADPRKLGLDQTIIFFNNNPDAFHYRKPDAPVDVASGIVCTPNNFKYDRPLDEGRIRVTALADPYQWLGYPDEEYARRKAESARAMVDSALRHVPDFRSHVVDTDIFTPHTIRKFTGHINGTVYGAPQKVSDGSTILENLYLCGTDQGLLGIVGAMLSGIAIANRYLLK